MGERSMEREDKDAPAAEGAANAAAPVIAAPEIPTKAQSVQAQAADIAKIVEATKFVESATPAAGATPSAFAIVPELPKIDAPATAPREPVSLAAPVEPAVMPKPAEPEPVERQRPAARPAAGEPTEARRMPPPFLREHATRPIPTKQPSRRMPPPPPVAAKAAATREKPRSNRFALLAGCVALAAACGAGAGALGTTGLARVAAAPAAHGEKSADVAKLKHLIEQLRTEVAAIKASAETGSRSAAVQFAKLNERLERSERQQAEPAAKLAKISEALERIEHRASAAADVTGSVKPAAQEAKAAPKPAILEDWVLRRVYDGSALIEGRVGVIEVEPGASLPGGGRVEAIRRQDGHWVVITNRGLIVSAR